MCTVLPFIAQGAGQVHGVGEAELGEVSRSMASLRISGEDLDPDEITGLLGKAPDMIQRRGQPMRLTRGRTGGAIMGFSSWSLQAEAASPSDLDLQVARILDGTTADMAVWTGIASRWKVDLFCGLFLETFNEGVTISPETLRGLGERGIELGLDIYGNGPVDIEIVED